MAKSIIRVVVLALPLLAATVVTAARFDPPTPTCYPCPDSDFAGQVLLP